ncbi:class F sortase [Pseudonocardia petroleophila]|uniref:class F sortase n=1 Tax=Pseudonocardia petroleophila TaxID=37331 RepID=UPI0021060E73|nr:class F sortase [Pseudonocardia petroleophila]
MSAPTTERPVPAHRDPGEQQPSRAPLRATAAAVLICVPLLGPFDLFGAAEEEATAPAVPLASAARVVRVDQPAPAARPTGLTVPAIGLAVPALDDLGIAGDGRLQAPEDFANVGWYTGGAAPGDPGPAVLVGHVDSWRGPAVFFRIRELTPGAEILVPRADGSTVRFVVDAVEQYPKDGFPTERVYGPTADPQLRLITCGGSFDRAAKSYRDNIVVYASMR